MLRLIEGSIASIEHDLVLVAPPDAKLGDGLHNVTVDAFHHQQLIRDMQRLRGRIYLDEGNVTREQLTADGRHQTAEDEKGWHLLMTDGHGRVRSCALYMLYENAASIADLRVRHCPLVQHPEWKTKVRGAVESEIARARRAGLRFAELGGWAIAKERRGTPEGLMMALGTYGLARMLGGALGITTANVAHSCSSILRRLGGSFLEFDGTTIPSYFDPRYNTTIDLLRFDSRCPNTKYANLIDIVKEKLANVTVIANRFDVALESENDTTIGLATRPMFAA